MMHAFTKFIVHFGLLAVLFVVFAELGLLFGFIFPGDSLLFVSGAAVQQDILLVNIHLLVALLIILLSIAPTFIHWLKQPAIQRTMQHQWSIFWRRKES